MAYNNTEWVASSGNTNIQFRMGVETTSQGIVGGVPQSVVNVRLQTRRQSSGTTTYKQSASTTMSVDGSSKSKTINYNVSSYTVGTWYTIWERTGITVNHSTSTGAKKLSVGFTINLSGTSADSGSGSWSVTLTTIPMGSTLALNATSYTISSSDPSATITITRYNNSYCHRLIWKLGSTQIGTNQDLDTATSASYTFTASSWLQAMTDQASAPGSCTLKTYTDNNYTTQVGVDSTVNFTIYCTKAPTIGSVTAATVDGISGIWIGSYTKALITASNAAGVNGSTISKYEFLQNNVVRATYPSTNNWTTPEPLAAGTYTFAVRVTDSRNNSTTQSTSVTVLSYAVPKISSVSIFRCNSGGTAENEGTYISVKATATATPTGNSITSLKVYTKEMTSSTWTDKGTLTSGTAKIINSYAYTSSWNVKIEATDAIGNTSTYTTTVPTAAYTMDFKAGGRGVSFGKVAETDDLVDSAWSITTRGTLTANALVDNEEWKYFYRKFNNIGLYGSNSAGTSGWYKVCTVSQSGYSNVALNLLVTSSFGYNASGIVYIKCRCNNSTTISVEALGWLTRYGFNEGDFIITTGTNTWSLYVYQRNSQYGRVMIQMLSNTNTGTETPITVTLADNNTVESSTPSGTVSTDLFSDTITVSSSSLSDAGTPVTATNGCTFSSCTFAKWGKMVHAVVYLTGATTASGSDCTFTLASAWRPVLSLEGTGQAGSRALIAYGGTSSDSGVVSVRNAGTTALSSSTTFGVRLTYLLP